MAKVIDAAAARPAAVHKATFDKIAKAAMSREMLAAGLTAAAAAIAASPKARKAIRDAGLDAADSASAGSDQMMTNASKLGSLIAEAVADAAQRVLSGKWADEATALDRDSKPRRQARRAAQDRRNAQGADAPRPRPPPSAKAAKRSRRAKAGATRQAPLERRGAQAGAGQAQGAAGKLRQRQLSEGPRYRPGPFVYGNAAKSVRLRRRHESGEFLGRRSSPRGRARGCAPTRTRCCTRSPASRCCCTCSTPSRRWARSGAWSWSARAASSSKRRSTAAASTTALQAEQKGTGHAVQMAEEALAGFDGPVLILYGDTPFVTARDA